jgi:hypothetical protein
VRNHLATEISRKHLLECARFAASIRSENPTPNPQNGGPNRGVEKGIKRATEAKSKAVRRGADDRTRLINPNSTGTEESTLPSGQSAADRAPKRRRSAKSSGEPGGKRERGALGFERVLEGSGGRTGGGLTGSGEDGRSPLPLAHSTPRFALPPRSRPLVWLASPVRLGV